MVIQYIFYFYRTERAKSDMQGYFCDIDSHILYFLQQFFRKMKPCCRGSGRSVILCIYGLIAVFIFQLMRNIWRQRHLSQLIQNLFKNSVIMELNQTVSFFYYIHDFCRQKPVSEHKFCARFCFFPRFYECLPDIIFLAF